jgi:aldehyde:ferredoxin oxidoreductase
VSGEEMKLHYHDRDTTCLKCPVACGKQYKIDEGEFAGARAKMPEYETIFALGPMLGISNPEALTLANDLCDLHGMDTISMGVTLAFVAEALERGWLDRRDLGVDFGWGDWRGMLRLVEMTARPRGIRRTPGRGRLAARRIGAPGRHEARLRREGAGAPGPFGPGPQGALDRLRDRDPRRAATTTRGPRPSTRRASTVAPPRTSLRSPREASTSRRSATRWSCAASPPSAASASSSASPTRRWCSAVTGWEVSVDELERVGERIVNLERLFNVREGVRRAQDVLPWKVMHEPIPDGPSAGMYCPPDELSAMLDDYYALRGWDTDGVPTRARLSALGLSS